MPHAPITRRLAWLLLFALALSLVAPTIVHADDPEGSLDCEAERQRLFEQCNRALESCNQQNCELHNGYSGCAVDCIGCFGMTLSWGFNEDRWALHPSYGACVVPVLEGYAGQVESIQADYLSGAINYGQQEQSERAVRDITSEALKACERSACEAKCADLGTTGGMEGWDCVCAPLPETDAPADEATESSGGGLADETSEQVTATDEGQSPQDGDARGDSATDSPADSDGQVTPKEEPSSDTAAEWWEDPEDAQDQTGAASSDEAIAPDAPPADAAPRRVHSFRIRPIRSLSAGIIYGAVWVRYEIQEVLDDGTTGRRCTVQFTGQGLTLGWPVGANFAPGYQWSEMQVPGGWSMSLEELHGVRGWHSSAGALVGGGSAMYFGGKNATLDKRLESRGLGWGVGPYAGADWMWGTWEIIEGPTGS